MKGKKNMTRSKLVKEYKKIMGRESVAAAREEVRCMLSLIEQGLLDDGEVKLSRLFTLTLKRRRPRTALNPRTQEAVNVPAKTVVGIIPSRDLRRKVEGMEL